MSIQRFYEYDVMIVFVLIVTSKYCIVNIDSKNYSKELELNYGYFT